MNLPLTHYRGLLGGYLKPQQGKVGLLAVLLFGSIGLQLLNPQVVRSFIDTTRSGGSERAVVVAAAAFIVIGLLQRAIALAAVYMSETVSWNATNRLRADLTRHLLRLDMPFHKQHTPGELIERVDGDVNDLANFFSQLVIQVLGNALLVAGILLLLFRESWRVGAGLGLYTVLTFLILGALQRRAVGSWGAARQAHAEQFGFLEERITGTEDVRANGGESYVLHRLYRLMRSTLLKERHAALIRSLTYFSTNFLSVMGYAVGLALGAYLYSRGHVTIGAAYVVVFYVGMLSAPLQAIREQIEDLQRATASINRVQELFATQRKVAEAPRTSVPPGTLGVEFQSVSFGYDDRLPARSSVAEDEEAEESGVETVPVLHEVSFRLEPGQVLGLLGRTGSGKTTITRLLFRLYDPAAGAIRLSDVDIRDVTLADLRGRVGMVTQDVQLFQASVRDNLTFFNRRVDDERIVAVLRELGLGDWYESLPAGLDTKLGAGGQGLSAGEAQLLAFARVFLRDPGLVILDEASSRLDPATERLLERAVDRLLRPEGTRGDARRTGIVIAHRLQTVQRADMIMILDAGRIVEYGPRLRLANDPGSHFFKLLQTGLEETLV